MANHLTSWAARSGSTGSSAIEDRDRAYQRRACLGALVDRFAQHCHVLDIDAESWRHKDALKNGEAFDGRIAELEKDWKAKYNSSFDIKDEDKVFNMSFASITETSFGTLRPASRNARIAPIAEPSLKATRAVKSREAVNSSFAA